MAHKTLISGTAYSVTGGREPDGGQVRAARRQGLRRQGGEDPHRRDGIHRTVFEGHSPEHHHPRRDPVPERIRQPRAVLYRQARLRERA
jgi:hypothetical protein